MGRKRGNTHLSTSQSNGKSWKKPKELDIQDEKTITKDIKTLPAKNNETRQAGELRPPPPTAPPTVDSIVPLVPPNADDTQLRERFDLHVVQVANWAKIESKVRHVLALFQKPPATAGNGEKASPRATLVSLVSRDTGANKCISIAEIAKRELLTDVAKIYQYTGYWTQLEQKRERVLPEEDKTDDLSQDEFYESAADDRSKVHNVPCLVIYLSKEPVAKLKSLYGQDICEQKAKPV
jgi:hypothetical protein